MSKNIKSNNHINLNKNFQFPPKEKSNSKTKNNNKIKNTKKRSKVALANSVINYKEAEIINNKQVFLSKRNSLKNKYYKIETTNEKSKINSNKTRDLKNNKYKNYSSNSKENNNILNCFSGRKNSFSKQISFISKLSNDEIRTTIDNENNEIKIQNNNENQKGINFEYNTFNNKKNRNNSKKNIYDYQINQLKQILIKKQNIKNNIDKILSNKMKNKSNNNTHKNYSGNLTNHNNNLNTNLASFSPIQKNNNLYKISSQSKKNILSNTNPNINYQNEFINTNTNSQKSLNNKKFNNNHKIINKEKNKNFSTNKYLDKKITEKSCPLLNINCNSIINIKEPFINDENLNKNITTNNTNLRKISNPHNNIKGVLKPFCSLINIPINNKEKEENNNKTTNNNNTSNEKNNYCFDKDKYFNEFKNRINLNINNLFFKSKRKKWKNIIEKKKSSNDNRTKDLCINNNYSNQENISENNIYYNFGEKMKKLNNLLTEKLSKNEITNEKTIRIQKIKAINLINNTNKKKYDKEKEDFILDDLFIKKRNARKRSSDNIKSSKINSKNYIHLKNHPKNSFTSFNRKDKKENNKRNYNSFLINVNITNSKGRNENIIYNNFFEPQTTIYQKNNIYKNKINNNTNANSNRNHYTRNSLKKDQSLTITRNKKEKNENKSVITSSRNKNFENNIFNDNNTNEKNYLKIIKLFDQITKYRKSKNRKKKDLEICFINNSNNSENNIDINNIKKKEKKKTIKIEVDENKVKENISQNTLTMYTIYILSKYYSNCNKVGLMKIIIFDKNGNNIPVICYNTNSNYNKNQNLINNTLFNNSGSNKFLLNKNKVQDKPFLMEFKKNLYINFYIKNIKSINIDYIQINNYSNIKESISPVKNIQIFKGNHLIYKGILNEKNEINKIFLNNHTNKKYSSMINQSNKNLNIENIKQRPLSSSKRKTSNNILLTKNYTFRKSEFNELNTKRNIFTKSCSTNYIFSDNNYNETNYVDKKSKAFMCNSKKHSANDIRNTKIITGNLRQELNISNTYTVGGITNNPQKTYGNKDKYLSHEDISGNSHRNFEKKLFYNSIKNSNKFDNNLSNNSNAQNKIIKKTEIINEYDNNNLIREGEKVFMKSNSEKKFKKSIIKTQKSLLFKKINEEKNNDSNLNNVISNTYFNLNNNHMNSNNNNIYVNNIKFNKNKKYIEFNKIRFVLTSNYGHNKYIGLTGIVFYNLKGVPINIETASSIGALPKDLKTILDDDAENRIFENIFNNFNNTNEPENMWVTKLKKTPPLSFIEIYFQDRIRLSRIKIFNYNERNKLEIGVKTIDLYLDDEFYETIFIRQGIGEATNDFITLNNGNNSSIEDFEKDKNYDFGQNITFPIITKNYNFNYMRLKNEIKYASFLYEQSYETPFLPCGNYIKFQFCNNYLKYFEKEEFGTLNYNDIGLDNIEIYDEEGKNLLKQDNLINKNNYKILSNCEINHNEEDKIILNGQNENFNNNIFYLFEKEIQISYIKFYPLTKNEKNENKISFNSLKEIKIFCENNIIFEGNLYINQPTIVLFTCDAKIIKNINEKYLTKYKKDRDYKESYNQEYISLVLN